MIFESSFELDILISATTLHDEQGSLASKTVCISKKMAIY